MLLTAIAMLLLVLSGPAPAWAAKRENIIIIDPPDTLFYLDNLEPGDSVSRNLTLAHKGDQPLFLWLINEWVAGDPEPGEPGDLYAQLLLTLRRGERIIYHGPICGLPEPLNLSAVLGPLRPGQTLPLELIVSLPGPETANEFQGSVLSTRFYFLYQAEDAGSSPELPRTGSGILPLLSIAGSVLFGMGLLFIKRGLN